ncbi:MAG: AbrB/MazE/SpoVT family DNA-binding domain-containing protein [Betaproteobacteria bacterium]|nr:AbrB/MazE/SpoVT family DNA-binding domain-containing protein [Betaproteobacteria bacterium]
MDLVKLGKKGQLTIPKSILKQTGILEDAPLLVEAGADGSIILRQAGVYPIEIYTDSRVREFEEADRMTPGEAARVKAALKRKAGRKR